MCFQTSFCICQELTTLDEAVCSLFIDRKLPPATCKKSPDKSAENCILDLGLKYSFSNNSSQIALKSRFKNEIKINIHKIRLINR